jgi:hypothetical protein
MKSRIACNRARVSRCALLVWGCKLALAKIPALREGMTWRGAGTTMLERGIGTGGRGNCPTR